MNCFVGIDLGSTTTKAIYLDENGHLLGRGITNSRSNYSLACQIAKEEALNNSRFALCESKFKLLASAAPAGLLPHLLRCYKLIAYQDQLEALGQECLRGLENLKVKEEIPRHREIIGEILEKMKDGARQIFSAAGQDENFFRDLAASQFLSWAQRFSSREKVSYERLVGIFDRAIISVEGKSFSGAFARYSAAAGGEILQERHFAAFAGPLEVARAFAGEQEFKEVNVIGTGYGRQRLPFAKEQIVSEILCHGLGASSMFPGTRTVLDIGGQDTKAIQVDQNGIVVNFQMNDRCAAGCGRYLGYVADEMNLGVHELGPRALEATRTIRINSTCTVFAGAEIRDRLSLGEKREDILAGLHRSIALRAMSLLARSGGIHNEFTFTGGVAKNVAATAVLKALVREHYGEITINISPDSIFTGAYGAALFARRKS